MTTQEILAMPAGPEIDALVHRGLGRPGKPAAYSTKPVAAAVLLDKLPLIGGRIAGGEAADAARPFIAAEVEWSKDLKACAVKFTVRSATLELALCKAALIHAQEPAARALPETKRPTRQAFSRPAPAQLEPIPGRSDKAKLPAPVDVPGERRST